jgi:hypothetical protein
MRIYACVLVAACGHHAARAPVRTQAVQGSLSAKAAADDPVVATVDGEEIHASEVARMAEAEHVDARAALDKLIDLDVAAAEALRQGLQADPEVDDTRKRESVRRFSEDQFLDTFTPADIPSELVDKVLAQKPVTYYFDHVRYQNTAFCRVITAKDAPKDAVAAARAQMQQIHDGFVASPPATIEDFLASCTAQATAMALKKGEGYDQDKFSTARQGSSVEEYASAAFTLKEHGDLTQPTRTPWGWDVIWLDSVITERHASRAEAEKEVRSWPQVLSLGRQQAFERWADGLVAKHAVTRDPALVERAVVETPVN